MSALFNVWMVKVVFTLISAVFLNPNVSQIKEVSNHLSIVSISRESSSDSLETDKEKEDSKGSVKITISDDGIKFHSGGKDQFILGIDSKNTIRKMVEEGIKSIPESLSINFKYNDEKKYKHVTNDTRVKIGESIHIKDDELVQGDVVSVLGGVTVDGKVSGDVVCVLGNIELGPTSVVNGDIVSVLGTLSKDDGARVRGETVTIGSDKFRFPAITFMPFGGGILRFVVKIIKFIVLILLLLMVLYFIPERIKGGSSYVTGSFLKSMGIGVLIVIFGSMAIVIVAVVLSITIIGIPLSLLLFLFYLALLMICYFISAIALGSFVSKKMKIAEHSIYLQGLIGLFLLEVDLLSFSLFWSGLELLYSQRVERSKQNRIIYSRTRGDYSLQSAYSLLLFRVDK